MQNNVDLPQGGHRSSAWADMNFTQIRIENVRNQLVKFVRNNDAERLRKTSQGSFELSL